MKILVTGASGFLGAFVVNEALRRGHAVRAILRPAANHADLSWINHPAIELIRIDLRAPAGIDAALDGCEAVIHLAAAKSGDFYTQMSGTVVATENLLAAMKRVRVSRLVATSSFAVYEYLRRWSGGRLDEDSPLAVHPRERDAYAQTKLIQETLLRRAARDQGILLTLLRPGVIFGPRNLWTARIGAQLAPDRWLRIGGGTRIPLTYVENCAEAILLAVESERAVGQILNVVDDDIPTQRRYLKAIRRRLSPPPSVIAVPWPLVRILARAAWIVNRIFFHGDARVPSLLQPAQLHSRIKPLRYTNQRIKEILGWRPRFALAEALDRSFGISENTNGATTGGPSEPPALTS
jgi:nucleoside-diphosphate-sugar epimerase